MTTKRSVATEDLYNYCWISDPSVCSKSGTIAYVHKTINSDKNSYRTNVRLIQLDGSNDRPFTYGEKDELPTWSPNGMKLAFLRTTAEGKQLWLLSLHGGEAVQLTTEKHGVGTYVWSPDGKQIAFTSRVADSDDYEAETAEKGKVNESTHLAAQPFSRTSPKSEGAGWWDGRFSHLFLLDLDSGQIKQVTFGQIDASQPFWSPCGKKLSFLAKIVDDPTLDPDLFVFSDIYTIKLSTGEIVKITDCSLSISQASYSPNGATIGFIGNNREFGSATQNNLYTVTADRGAHLIVNVPLDLQIGNAVLSDMKASAASPAPLYDPIDESSMYAEGSLHGNAHVYRFQSDGSYEAVTRGKRDVYQFTITADGRYLIVAATDAVTPGELYRVDTRTGAELRLTAGNDKLMSELEGSAPESFWFKSSDGWDLQGWLMKPKGMIDGKKYPLLLQIHGGPHALYANSYSHEFQLMAAQGYCVLYINPRGSFGYGQHFVRACRGDFGGKDYEDLMEAVDYALSTFDFIDETRLGVGGGSYGGFLTNWIVAHSNRFHAAVTDRSISNWLSFYGTSDIGISYTEGEIEGNPWEHAERLWDRSPLAYVKNIQTPLLIIHGEQDLRCPIGQAEELYTALKRLGKQTEFIRFPKSNHALSRSGIPSLRVERLNHAINWFNRYLCSNERED